MRKFRTFLMTPVILAAGLLLASCAHQKGSDTILVSNCPAVGLVKYTSTLTKFAKPEQTNKDVVFDAYLTDVDRTCEQGESVSTDISFTIRAKKGPAFDGKSPTVKYFVVVVRDNYLVVNKEVFSTTINFKPGQDTAAVKETLRQNFSNYQEAQRYDYEVLVGFQVSPEELEFNVVR